VNVGHAVALMTEVTQIYGECSYILGRKERGGGFSFTYQSSPDEFCAIWAEYSGARSLAKKNIAGLLLDSPS
jgi:hypothetical protein